MSKFKVGDHVRVTEEVSVIFDQIAQVEAITSHGLYGIRVGEGVRWWYPANLLILADPEPHSVADRTAAESALPQADLEPHFAAIKESQAEWDAMVTPDPVNNPSHYTSHPSGIECIEITRHMGFNLGNAFKYLWRADLKGNAIQDLEKAAFYIADEIAKREAAQ